jgi:hypothetical protein
MQTTGILCLLASSEMARYTSLESKL